MRRTVWLVTSLFAVSGSVFGAASAALPAQAATLPALMKPSASVADSVDAAANFDWINALRVAAGAPAVQMQSWAAGVAQAHSLDMAAQGLLFHNISGYMDEGHAAMDSVYLGENVAMGTNLSYAEAAIQASPPHMAILLDPKYNYVGVGAAIDATGQVWITEDFAEINSAPPVTTVAVKPVAPAPKPVAP
ncbi:MAG TPA: CAP domain-containing protein, partial [Actinomycetota bacterium]|nr:CAP domain-containing protein [Actinomycetota bacterium]